MKEETIKKKTRQRLVALGAILAMIVALTLSGVEDVWTFIGGLALLGLYGYRSSSG